LRFVFGVALARAFADLALGFAFAVGAAAGAAAGFLSGFSRQRTSTFPID
jgi:hypothetical protein